MNSAMETINDRELTYESIYPDEDVLKSVLGRSFRAYCALLDLFDRNGMHWEWRYYQDGKAWLCKVQSKKKTIVWMSAWKGYMKAAVYLPERLLDELFGLAQTFMLLPVENISLCGLGVTVLDQNFFDQVLDVLDRRHPVFLVKH